MPLDCDNNNLSLEQILASIIAENTEGNCAIRLIPVAAAADVDWKTCEARNQSLDQLIKRIVGVDGNGNIGIRVILGTDATTNCKDCSKNQLPLEDIFINHVIGLADDGHPALRLAQP